MAAHFYIHDGDDWVEITDRVNLTDGPSLMTRAEEGAVAFSQVVIDDPDEDLVIDPYTPFLATEDDSTSDDKVWASGQLVGRRVVRTTGTSTNPLGRFWACDLVDDNNRFHRRIFKGGSNRDEETDNERADWVLDKLQDWNLVDDITTYVSDGNESGDLDEQDFRGQYADDILMDTSQAKSKNYWIQRQGDLGDITDVAWWGSSGNTNYSSPLYLTNDQADLGWRMDLIRDGVSTVYPMSMDNGLRCIPDRMYSGAYARHRSGAIYRRESTTVDIIGVRDVNMAGTDQMTKARAITRAERYLEEFDVEDFRVDCRVRLPAAKVTQLRAGMRVRAAMTHWPFGFDDWYWWRVISVSVRPDPAGIWYTLDMELASTSDAATGPPSEGVEVEFSGGIIHRLTGGNVGGPYVDITATGTGDDPATGYPGGPILDTDLFTYLPNAGGWNGFTALVDIDEVELYLHTGFTTTLDNQTASATCEIRINGTYIWQQVDNYVSVGVNSWGVTYTETVATPIAAGDIITIHLLMTSGPPVTDRQWIIQQDGVDKFEILPGTLNVHF